MGFSVSLRAILEHRRMATSKEMTAGPALPLILKFTLPLLLGNLLQQTYSLVDAAIVGKFLGINALASVGASTSVVFLILGFCNGCCGGFGIPVAQKFGARDYSTMRSYISVSLKLSVVMSVTIAIVTSILCADILQMMRTPENIFEGAYAYLLVTFIGVPFTFFYNLLSSIIRALGDSKTPFWFLLLSTVLNIVLDLFCILVLGWGVAGELPLLRLSHRDFRRCSVIFICIVSLTFCRVLRRNGGSSRSWLRRCFISVYQWDCSFPLRLSVVSCFRAQTMRWVRLVWLPLLRRCVSRCSLSVRSRVWESLWLLIADRITVRANRNVSGWGLRQAS